MRKVTAVLFILAGLMSLGMCIDPSRVFLVDQIGKNFLFRTSTPVSGKTYQMAQLQSIMAEKLSAAGLEYPTNPQMHAYSLINVLDSIKEGYVENLYFDTHPQYKYTSYPVYGSLINPNKYPTLLRRALALTYAKWDHDKMNVLTEELRADLELQEDTPKIIFFHCLAGEDRTGQVFGSYVMRYMNWSYEQALVFDNHVEDREIHTASVYGLNWFCYYLNDTENKGGDCTYQYVDQSSSAEVNQSA